MVWVQLVKSWHDTSVDVCDVCGNLLIRRYWEFTSGGGARMRACSEDDEALHSWLAQYRTDADSWFPDTTHKTPPDLLSE